MSDAIEIIQTDTKSFFASCNICGEGVTSDTKKKSERWADNHAPADVAYLLAELRKAHEALTAVTVLAESWRYKGEFGWGAWQEGYGPDEEGYILDQASTALRAAVAAANGDGRG